MSSILFTVIITRSDVVFTASWLTTFNQNFRKSHHETADQAIQYLYTMKNRALKYEKNFRTQSLSLLFNLSIELQSTRLINLTHFFSFASSCEAIYLYTDCYNHILAFSHLCESKTLFSETYLQSFNFESFWSDL